MNKIKPLIALLLLVAGCTNQSAPVDDGFTYTFSVEGIISASTTPAEAAEEMAKGAEQLLHAKGFAEADRVATEALKLDPKNLRAGFLKALLKVLLLQKGLAARLKPLAERSPKLKADWEREVGKLTARHPSSTMYYSRIAVSFSMRTLDATTVQLLNCEYIN